MEEPEKPAAWERQEDGGGPETAELNSARRSRRAAQKKVVTIPVGATEGLRQKNGSGGEVFPPTDSWAWRKYGQKPIKGSPHPRGYYRCSSCKGCPARKQVERSRADPSTLIITYSFEHNHPWPLPKHGRHHQNHQPPAPPPLLPPRESAIETKETCPPVIREQDPPPSVLAIDDGGFGWFSDVASPSSTSAGSDELLYGSVHFGSADAVADLMAQEEREAAAAAAAEEEEDSLFAGLGELPEYSVVLRRGLAAATWTGTTG